jgi:AhpD family alkylhydroperoxidase
MTKATQKFMQKACNYGLQEFLDIMGELSQESTKKGQLSRLQKELITLGLALYKNCQRCISIHSREASKLEATDSQLSSVKKIILFMNASPHSESVLWDDWEDNWKAYSHSKIIEKQQLREMIALAISIVMQHEKQIELHLTTTLDIGISIEQIFEIVPLVMLMDGAPTLSQIPKLVACYEKHSGNKENN